MLYVECLEYSNLLYNGVNSGYGKHVVVQKQYSCLSPIVKCIKFIGTYPEKRYLQFCNFMEIPIINFSFVQVIEEILCYLHLSVVQALQNSYAMNENALKCLSVAYSNGKWKFVPFTILSAQKLCLKGWLCRYIWYYCNQ